MNKSDICYLSACELAEKIASQELTSVEITETIIERILKINPLVNAYCTPTFELAREMAQKADKSFQAGKKLGVLHGIPFSTKDEMIVKGVRTTFGSKLYENYIPDETDVCIERLINAGGVLLGKTNLPEFGHTAGLTENFIFGFTKNPWDLEKSSGGSSGGAAVAVASGLGPLALGADGGGSIRVPSSLCGVFGLKPTFGRIPRSLIVGIYFWTMDHYGPIVRYVSDAALMLNVMKGYHPFDKDSLPNNDIDYLGEIKNKPKKIKIGYSMDLGFFKSLDDEVEKIVINKAQQFTKFDWEVDDAMIKLKKPDLAFNILVSLGYAYDFKKDYNSRPDDLSADFKNIIKAGLSYKGQDVAKAMAVRKEIYRALYNYFEDYDILITPTTPTAAFKVEKTDFGTRFPTIKGKPLSITSWMSYTYPFNLTGLPAASIPCGWTKSGLPIGMQIVGKRFDELLVLQVAKAFEEMVPWQDKKPKFE